MDQSSGNRAGDQKDQGDQRQSHDRLRARTLHGLQTGRYDMNNPAGTTGHTKEGTEKWQQGNEPNRPGSNQIDRDIDQDDEDSGIGNRSTNR